MRKEEKVKVSIIVPVYNVEKYLEKCLDSLVNQTLKQIEIIVVNDGSPDNSQKIIDKYAKKYPNKIKSFIKKNGGLSDARNFGIERANGKYIAFVDSDDFVDLQMFEKMYNYIEESKCKIAVCNLVKYYENTNRYVNNNFIIENQVVDVTTDEKNYLNKARSFAWNKIYDKTLFEKFKFPVGQVFEDSSIIYNIMFECKEIFVTNEALYYYRINREGAITTTIDDRIFDIFKSCDSIINYHKEKGTFDLYYEKIQKVCLIHIFARINHFKYAKENKIKRRFINKTFEYLDQKFPTWRDSSYFGKSKKIRKKLNRKIKQNKKLMLMNIYFPKSIKRFCSKIIKFFKRKKSFFKKQKRYKISKERLRDLQEIELEILLEIDKVCKKNNIKYYLLEGSLLGAVRHNGFIPWDDDLDIGMLREDYDKFKKIANQQLTTGYVLCNEDSIKNYHLPFMKVVTLNNRSFRNNDAKSLGKVNGPFVDIFPLDKTDKPLGKYQRKKYMKIRKYRDMLLIKANYHIRFSFKRVWYYFCSVFYSNKKLHSKIYNLSVKDNSKKNASYIVNYASSYKVEKEIFPISTFGDGKSIKFETCEAMVPDNYNYVLTKIYGNYMKLPPKEKQKTQHSISDLEKKIDFEEGDYDE